MVEVHNGGAGAGPLVYRVGHLSGAGEETITWGLSQVYDYGNNPLVALCGNFVVEVHNGGADAGPLWYRLGWVSGSTITWGDSHQYDTGYNPSVSIFGTPSPPGSPLLGSFVFEAHNGGVPPAQCGFTTALAASMPDRATFAKGMAAAASFFHEFAELAADAEIRFLDACIAVGR